jgi:hypothetical protein
VVFFLLGYLADVAGTYAAGLNPTSLSLVPFAGPILQLSDHFGYDAPAGIDPSIQAQIDQVNRLIQTAAQTALVIDAILQIGGATMVLAGATLWQDVPYYAAAPPRAERPRVTLLPTPTGGQLIVRF